MVERMTWMRARVARLLPGTAGEKAGRINRNTVNAADQKTVAGVMRRLNRDRPALEPVHKTERLKRYFRLRCYWEPNQTDSPATPRISKESSRLPRRAGGRF